MNVNKKIDKIKGKTKEPKADMSVDSNKNSSFFRNTESDTKSTINEQSTSNTGYLVQIVKDIKIDENGQMSNKEPHPIHSHIENDIKALENNAHIKKMHPKKLKFHKRNFKLDVKNQRLIASTGKCFKRERVCKL